MKQDLERTRALDLPGGIVLVGGGAILPGIIELAQEVFGVNTKLLFQIKLVSAIQHLQV